MEYPILFNRLAVPYRRLAVLALLLLSGVFGILVGHAGHRLVANELSDGGFIMTDQGNNLLVFTPSLKPKDSYYDNGKALTIWLRMHKYETQHPLFYADLIRFYYDLFHSYDKEKMLPLTEPFHFESFPLSVRHAENLIIEIIPDE